MARLLNSEERALIENALRYAAKVYVVDAAEAAAHGDARIEKQFARQAEMADRLADEIMGADGVKVLG